MRRPEEAGQLFESRREASTDGSMARSQKLGWRQDLLHDVRIKRITFDTELSCHATNVRLVASVNWQGKSTEEKAQRMKRELRGTPTFVDQQKKDDGSSL